MQVQLRKQHCRLDAEHLLQGAVQGAKEQTLAEGQRPLVSTPDLGWPLSTAGRKSAAAKAKAKPAVNSDNWEDYVEPHEDKATSVVCARAKARMRREKRAAEHKGKKGTKWQPQR